MVPVVGGVIGGGIDVGATKIIGGNAYRLFIKGEMPKKFEELVEIGDDDVIIEDEPDSTEEISPLVE